PPAAAVVADGAGRFRAADLHAGDYVATASAPDGKGGPGRSAVFTLASGQTRQITVVLAAAGHLVEGRVVDAGGASPIVGAGMRARTGFRQVRSDDGGNFAFDDGEAGSYQVQASRGPLSGRGPLVHIVEAQAVTGVEIALDPLPSVFGTVVDEKGKGVGAARV